jgi:hypothetical protein
MYYLNLGIILHWMAISIYISIIQNNMCITKCLELTTIPYKVACYIDTCCINYDIVACLGLRSQRVVLAMPLVRPQVLPPALWSVLPCYCPDALPSVAYVAASLQPMWVVTSNTWICDCLWLNPAVTGSARTMSYVISALPVRVSEIKLFPIGF